MIEGQESPTTLYTMLQRAKEVGNLPRYIVSKNGVEARKKSSIVALKGIKYKDIRAMSYFTGVMHSNQLICGFIFTVNIDVNAFEDYTDDSVGYDGQLIPNYGKQTISLMSNTILKTIENRKLILLLWELMNTASK
jgi:hypothetical protein